MKSSVENLEPTLVKMTVEVPVEELKSAIDQAYKKISNQVNLPGFRKGKVPPRLIDQRFGRGVVYEEAINARMQALYTEAAGQAGIHPIMAPEIEVAQLPALEGPLSGELVFTAEVCVRPEIKAPTFEGLDLQVDPVKVEAKDVEDRLDDLRIRFATLKAVKRKAKKGDFVTIDLRAEIDGKEIDSVSGISYEVGSANMLEGQDKAITGLAAGDSATFESTLAGGEHAGEKAQISVAVSAVKERELPAVDDEFAQLVSEFDTVEELRKDLEKQVEQDKGLEQAMQARELVLAKLVESTEFPTPAKLAETETAARQEREGVKKTTKRGKEIAAEVEKEIREQLVLDVLAEEMDLQVSQDEILNFMIEYSRRHNIDPSEFIRYSVQNQQITSYAMMVAREKVVEKVLRSATVTDGKKAVDLSAFLSDEPETKEADSNSEEDDSAGAKKSASKKPATKKSAPKKTATKTVEKEAAADISAKKAAVKKPAAKKSTKKEEK